MFLSCGYKKIKISNEELKAIFKKNNWISEFDEFVKNEPDDKKDETDQGIKNIDQSVNINEEYRKLKAEYDAMKIRLDELETSKKPVVSNCLFVDVVECKNTDEKPKERKIEEVIDIKNCKKKKQNKKENVDKDEMHVVERKIEVVPMLINIDFKTSKKYDTRQYSNEHIESVVKRCTKYLKKYLNIHSDDLKAFVFEKSKPTYDQKNKNYKDGFHVVYPFVPLDVKKRYFFLDTTKQEIIKEDCFNNIPFTNQYDDIFDSSVINNNEFLMYGSSTEGRDPYVITKIYNYDMSTEPVDNSDNNSRINTLLRQYSDKDVIKFKTKFCDLNEDVETLYIHHCGQNKKENVHKDEMQDLATFCENLLD
jgi:hypothetical protein